MLFVDTSVWIDLLADHDTAEVGLLLQALDDAETICFTGMILQEILQGVASPRERAAIEAAFGPFIEIIPERSTHLLAAELFRQARAGGHPIRSSVDCLIAACCIQQEAALLEKDRDFRYLSEVSQLRLVMDRA